MSNEGKRAPAKKAINSYSLLQMKMQEVEKEKGIRPASSSKSSSSSNLRKEEKKMDPVPEKQSRGSPKPKKQVPLGPNEPDRSYGDFFCRTCDSHMNSNDMWIAHITGKRHIKNIKKGDTDSKYEDLDDESAIKYEIRNVKDAVIGLNYIHEIRRREPGVPAMYNCFLCHASIATVPLVIEHVIGMKHRLNFMRENDAEAFLLMEQTNLKKGHLEPIVAEKAAKLEEEFGRGVVKVKQEKPKIDYNPYKRNYDSDEDRPTSKKSSKSHKKDDKTPTVWRSIDVHVPVKDYRDEYDSSSRRDKKSHYYPDDRDDDYIRSRSHRENFSADRDDYRRSFSRSSDHDDFRRSTDDYSREYSRSDSMSKPHYSGSPERERDTFSSTSIPKRMVLNEKYSPLEFSDARHFLQARSQDRTLVSSVEPPAPSAAQSSSESSADGVRTFINQLYTLPVKLFLKITAQKMEEWKTIDVGKEEMELFLKIHYSSQDIIHRNLPPQIQAMLKENMASKIENGQGCSANLSSSSLHAPPAQSSVPPSTQNPQSSPKFTLDDINELVFGARKASESSSSNQQTHISTYNPTPNVPVSASQSSAHFSAPSPSANFRPSSNDISSSANFRPSSNDISSSANFRPPSNNPAANFPPPAANFPLSNRFPPLASSLPHPGNFSHQSNYVSTNKTSPSDVRYSTYQGNPNSNIPGLTLTGENPPQSELSPYHWPNDNRGTFKRY